MNPVTLRILDQVNCKFDGPDPHIRRRIVDRLKYFVPYARHTPMYKLGRWDGKIGFATVSGGTFINLLDRVLPIVMSEGYEIEIEDLRPDIRFDFPTMTETYVSDRVWPEGHPDEGEPIVLRDYQIEAINHYLANPQSIQSISTGAGKTLLTACLSLLCEPYGRTLVIVPSKSLVEQTGEDYANLGLDVGVYYGDRKEFGHKHTICTWQGLEALAKRQRDDLDIPITMEEFTDGISCVMVDECHSAKSDVLKNLLTGPLAHVPIRWGLTGTVPKEDYEVATLLAAIGPVVGEIRAVELQEKGVLSRCEVEIRQLDDSHVAFGSYHDENKFLTTDTDRIKFIADEIRQIAETGNTLILVEKIECGEMLTELLPGAVFVNGQVKTKDRRKEYKEVQTSQNKIIVATYGVAAVGINIPRIFNLVLFEAGKSFVRVIQSIGRGIRKAKDKDFVQIYDFCSSMKFSARHLTKRKAYYKEAEYPHFVKKVKYR